MEVCKVGGEYGCGGQYKYKKMGTTESFLVFAQFSKKGNIFQGPPKVTSGHGRWIIITLELFPFNP